MKGLTGVIALFLFFVFSSPAVAGTKTVLASWYGPGLEGKLMANQQPFDSNDPTIAASPTLPFGTVLLVENPANGLKLVVVVQDRGPFIKGRGLDLSYAAARKLGYADRGVARLTITEIDI